MSKTPKTGQPKRIGPGRPTMYTPELADEICTRVGLREPMSKICAEPGMPSERTILMWRLKHDDFATKLERAREHRALARADKIDDYVEQLALGKLDPHAARVMIDAEKWQAGKELPKRYGEKLEVGGRDGRSLGEELGLGAEAVMIKTARWVADLLARANDAPNKRNGDIVDLAPNEVLELPAPQRSMP
jgi:hypothetical protein